jgi:hypothetical protein
MTSAATQSSHRPLRPGPSGLHPEVESLVALLDHWLAQSLPADRHGWFRDQIAAIAAGDRRSLLTAVGLAPRRLGKADLTPGPGARRDAGAQRAGFDPSGLSVDQTARMAFVLASYRTDDTFAATLDDLCSTADVQELVAYYRGLAVFPAGPLLRARAGEGIRSAMRPVFEAVAHRNPYPRTYFDEAAWNQMVLKALFIGSTLAPIQGLDERANPDLAATLVDYAHERWAAGRTISPELWRCVGPFADERGLAALERALKTGTRRERRAAALALEACPDPRAADIISRSGQGTETGGWDEILAEEA